MEKSEEEIKEILSKHSKQIEQINKMLLNMYSISNIRFWYSCLSNFRKSEDVNRDILQMEALTTSIIISYGRIFGVGTGSTILNDKIIPDILFPIHKEIINLRHSRYAHHGEDSFLEKAIDVSYDGSSFVIIPKLEIGFWLGAPKKWADLFEWLDGYMYDKVQNTIKSLSSKTGIEWKFPHGSTPLYI